MAKAKRFSLIRLLSFWAIFLKRETLSVILYCFRNISFQHKPILDYYEYTKAVHIH